MLVALGTNQLDEFYPPVAIGAVMRIMRDPALSTHHNTAIQVYGVDVYLFVNPHLVYVKCIVLVIKLLLSIWLRMAHRLRYNKVFFCSS